jgi:hypothetical protein
MTNRTTAAIVGALYIIGTVAGVLSTVAAAGLTDAPNYLDNIASDPTRAQLTALLVLAMGVALAMVPAVMFPILRRQNETLAIGYVIFRGALETLTYVGIAICWLLLVQVAQQQAHVQAAAAAPWRSLGTLVVKAQDPVIAIQDIVFSLGALMFYYLLYQARLVPRWLSGWGLVGVAGYFTAGVIAVFGSNVVVLLLPLAVQEMVMAFWLIIRGFNPASLPSGDHERVVSERDAATVG